MVIKHIKKKVIEAETRPIILHEIPGRVRFGVKALKRLKKDKLPLAESIKSILEEIPAIEKIEINTISGSLLINFNKEMTGTNQIKDFLKDVIRYLITYSDKFLSVDERDLPKILKNITQHIIANTDEALKFTAEKIPDTLL